MAEEEDNEERSSDSDDTRRKKRTARRLAIKALLKNPYHDSGLLPGSEHEMRREPRSKSAVERFKEKIRMRNRGNEDDAHRVHAAGSGDSRDHFDDLRSLQAEAEAMSGTDYDSENSARQARHALAEEAYSETEEGQGQFTSTRQSHVAKSDAGLEEEPVDDSSIDYGTYSEPASPLRPDEGANSNMIGGETLASTGYYDPAAEGAFTWDGGQESLEHLNLKRPDYFMSHMSSPEEAQAKHAALVQAMETSFEVDPEVKVPLPGKPSGSAKAENGDDNPFDLSVEMNPFEVKALAGGFRDDYDAEDASIMGDEEEDGSDGEALVLSPLLKAQAKDTGAGGTPPLKSALASPTPHSASQKRVRYKLDPGHIVTSPPREMLDAFAKSTMKGHVDVDSQRRETVDVSEDLDAKHLGDSSADRERGRMNHANSRPAIADEEDEDTPLALDSGASIEPSSFASLYEVLEPACQFSCEISPLGDALANPPGASAKTIQPEAVTAHLQRVGFQVVATGPVPPSGDITEGSDDTGPSNCIVPGFKMFLFASGYKLKQREGVEGDALPIFGLCELVIKQERYETGKKWVMSIEIRCTQKKHATGFVAELSLGNLFDLR